jgi:hypothetical protein
LEASIRQWALEATADCAKHQTTPERAFALRGRVERLSSAVYWPPEPDVLVELLLPGVLALLFGVPLVPPLVPLVPLFAPALKDAFATPPFTL